MIYGIGSDLIKISRIEQLYQRYPSRLVDKLLVKGQEQQGFKENLKPMHYLAKRFAAKEAFGKALGMGVAWPATLLALSVAKDAKGKPYFVYAPSLDLYMKQQHLSALLSLSDEQDYALAYVIIEKREDT